MRALDSRHDEADRPRPLAVVHEICGPRTYREERWGRASNHGSQFVRALIRDHIRVDLGGTRLTDHFVDCSFSTLSELLAKANWTSCTVAVRASHESARPAMFLVSSL